jgi:hypothetical protein
MDGSLLDGYYGFFCEKAFTTEARRSCGASKDSDYLPQSRKGRKEK